MSTCFLDSEFVLLADARVSVLDRGFIFGDGIYEVIPVIHAKPFRLAAHLDRLAQSLAAVAITDPYSRAEWITLIYELIALNQPAAGLSVYLHVTRGVAPRNHAAPSNVLPTVFMMATALAIGIEPAPVAAIVLDDIRWQRCDIKAISLLPNVMARNVATAAGVYEAILVRDGYLTEGAASNVFVVHEGRIKTPPKSGYILPGITRDVVIEALAACAEPVLETQISRAALFAASEIWLTSSSRDIVPVNTLEARPVGTGDVGPVFRRINERYSRFKAADLADAKSATGSGS